MRPSVRLDEVHSFGVGRARRLLRRHALLALLFHEHDLPLVVTLSLAVRRQALLAGSEVSLTQFFRRGVQQLLQRVVHRSPLSTALSGRTSTIPVPKLSELIFASMPSKRIGSTSKPPSNTSGVLGSTDVFSSAFRTASTSSACAIKPSMTPVAPSRVATLREETPSV